MFTILVHKYDKNTLLKKSGALQSGVLLKLVDTWYHKDIGYKIKFFLGRLEALNFTSVTPSANK